MTVTSESERGERSETPRWQVLTVRDGRIADIRGYDDETAASAAAGPPD